METTQSGSPNPIDTALRAITSAQCDQGNLLRMLAERLEEVVQMLTPEPKDGPSLDELIGQVIGQQSELINYARTTVKMLAKQEQNLPEDVVRALTERGGSNGAAGGNRSSRA